MTTARDPRQGSAARWTRARRGCASTAIGVAALFALLSGPRVNAQAPAEQETAAPAIAFSYLFRGLVAGRGKAAPSIGGVLAGFSSVLGGALLIALLLDLSGEGFLRAGQVVVLAHLPVMVIEGVITAMIVLFIRKVKPEMFEVAHDFEKESI